MRILVDARPICDSPSGGVTRVARALMTAYAETFPQDELICVTTGWRQPTLPDELRLCPNVTHRHYRIPNKLFSALATVYCLPSTVYRDVDALFLPNIGFIGALPQKIPTILLLHDLSFVIEPRWFTWKQRLWHRAVRAKTFMRSATRLLAVSETTKRDATRLLGIPSDRIAVIPIGPTMQIEKISPPLLKRGQGEIRYALVLGCSDHRKNAATAIVSVRQLRMNDEFRDVTLTVVGAIHELPLPEWIRHVSHPSDRELANFYAHAAVFLYPSWYEGYGLPLHEAARFGTPCIASTAGALPETAPPGTLFANPAKPHEWVEALRIALTQSPTFRASRFALQDTLAWTQAAKILREELKLKHDF